MSYYATYKPTAEAMEKYKPSSKTSGWFTSTSTSYMITEAKLSLLEIAMTDKYNEKRIDDMAVQVRLAVAIIKQAAENATKEHVWSCFKDDNEVWFCGWKYSNDGDNLGFEDEEEFQNQILERIFMYSRLIKTPDYFDREQTEKWEELYNDVVEYVDFIYSEYSDYYDKKFMEDMKEYHVPDGYDDVLNSSQSNTNPEENQTEGLGTQQDI